MKYHDLNQIEKIHKKLLNRDMHSQLKRNEFIHWYEIKELSEIEVELLNNELESVCRNYVVIDTYGSLNNQKYKLKIYNIEIV